MAVEWLLRRGIENYILGKDEMKLSMIIPSFYPATIYGGPIFATLHAAEALAKNGIETYVSTTDANGKNRLKVKTGTFNKLENNLYVKYYKETIVGKLSLDLITKVDKDIAAADIVHIQSIFSTPTPISLFYAARQNKPILLTPRGSLCNWCLQEGKFLKKAWLKSFIDPFAKEVVWHATSENEKNDILSLYPDAKIATITDGVNSSLFKKYNALSKKEYMKKFTGKSLAPKKIIISMGRIHKVKGFDLLIRAFKTLSKEKSDIVLCIAGEDEGEKNKLEKLINELKVESSVFFTGPLSNQDKVDFLANADLFVLASHTENFGIVIAESLASGTPVVVSNKAPWQIVENYECGLWVPNRVEELSNAMAKVLEKDREQLRKNAQELAKKFEWDNIAHDFIKLYKKMVEK